MLATASSTGDGSFSATVLRSKAHSTEHCGELYSAGPAGTDRRPSRPDSLNSAVELRPASGAPASDGNLHRVQPEVRVQLILPGLRSRDLRHSHKTWISPTAFRKSRSRGGWGTRIPDEIRDVYSHVAAEVEARLLDSLERHWREAVATVHENHGPTITQPLLLAA